MLVEERVQPTGSGLVDADEEKVDAVGHGASGRANGRAKAREAGERTQAKRAEESRWRGAGGMRSITFTA
jgi:hypothetical protein